MQLHKRQFSDRSISLITLLVIAIIGLSSWTVITIKHRYQTNSEKHYFTQLPNEVKGYYLPQLSIFKSPAPVGLWQTQCYQDVGYADNTAPITCGVVAKQLFGTTLSSQDAQAKFQQLATLASKQGFTNAKTAANYKPAANTGIYNTADNITIPFHFTAIAPDTHCSVSVDYGPSNILAPSPYLTIPTDVTDQSSMAIYYDFACSKQTIRQAANAKQNDYIFPGTAGGYPLTQDHYGDANPFIVAH